MEVGDMVVIVGSKQKAKVDRKEGGLVHLDKPLGGRRVWPSDTPYLKLAPKREKETG